MAENSFPKVLISNESKLVRESLSREFINNYKVNWIPTTNEKLLDIFLKNPEDYAAIIMNATWIVPESFSYAEKRESNGGLSTWYVIIDKIRAGEMNQNPEIPIILYNKNTMDRQLDENTRYISCPELTEKIFLVLMDMWNERSNLDKPCDDQEINR